MIDKKATTLWLHDTKNKASKPPVMRLISDFARTCCLLALELISMNFSIERPGFEQDEIFC